MTCTYPCLPDPTPDEERILVERTIAGDVQARDRLLWSLTRLARASTARVVCVSGDVRNDLMQDVLEKILLDLPRILLERITRVKNYFTCFLTPFVTWRSFGYKAICYVPRRERKEFARSGRAGWSTIHEADISTTDDSSDQALSLNKQLERQFVSRVLREWLSPIEYTIVCCHFGLHNTKPQSLAAIGVRLGCTRSRVQQREQVAFCKLRRSIHAKVLRSFY